MSSNFTLVDPQGWEWDLQSVYAAYMGHFQYHNIPWYDRTWAPLFESFEKFIEFTWPVIVVTDTWTGRAHIVTKTSSINAFLKMIKTRYGETLPQVESMLRITAFETAQRPLRHVPDWATYKKLHATLPAAALSAYKARVRAGEPQAVQKLWDSKDKAFLAIDFEWSERNAATCLEWGYAAMRCGHLDAAGVWPPVPDKHYRKGHYVVAEYIDKIHNKHFRNFPWEFGDTQVVGKAKFPEIISALISSLASPDSETTANNLVLVAHGINGDLDRLSDLKIKVPNNVLILDTAVFERQLFSTGRRGLMTDANTGKARGHGSTLSLGNMLLSFGVDVQCQLHNAGNDAFLALLGLQLLLDPENTTIPPLRGRSANIAHAHSGMAVAAGVAPNMGFVRVGGMRPVSHSPVGVCITAPAVVAPVPGMVIPIVPDPSRMSYAFAAVGVPSPLGSGSTPSPRERTTSTPGPGGFFEKGSRNSSGSGVANGGAKNSPRKSDPAKLAVQSQTLNGKGGRRSSFNPETMLKKSMDNLAIR
ncbi:hypothetical protein BD410DRAFT_783391 [Rickenella mellea]|uniref:Gfd2/YDR514C-like C-terminal domain-containing protein n=1 Tax=Rickenella mellea TaxID=50990 RepID=A0A4Y7QG86_9AGAM|nr:hypothetical protein BD410DRAFT_783391 [Rickenella mellea]